MRKTQILMNKTVYLSLLISYLNKSVTHEFWYYYAKTKYVGKPKLFYMDTDSFIVHIKADFAPDSKQDLTPQIMN